MHGANIPLPGDEYDWELYHRKVGSDDAARALSVHLAELLEPVLATLPDCSLSWRRAQAARIRDQMLVFMQHYRHLGAADEEPQRVLAQVLQRHLRVELGA